MDFQSLITEGESSIVKEEPFFYDSDENLSEDKISLNDNEREESTDYFSKEKAVVTDEVADEIGFVKVGLLEDDNSKKERDKNRTSFNSQKQLEFVINALKGKHAKGSIVEDSEMGKVTSCDEPQQMREGQVNPPEQDTNLRLARIEKDHQSKITPRKCAAKKPYKCEYCSQVFKFKCLLKKHLLTHTDGSVEKKKRKKKDKSEGIEKADLDEASQDALAACLGLTRNELDPAQSKKRGRRPDKNIHRCEYCFQVFKYRCYLKKHLLIHTGERAFMCDHCGQVFSHNRSLKSHIRTHTGEKPFVCDQCGKRYGHRFCLVRHLSVHTGNKPHKCTVCEKSFITKEKLTTHFRIHTGEKPYQCSYCERTFNLRGNLKKHMRVHTGERPYKCNQCGQSFTQSGPLKAHLRIHTGEKLFECDQCSQKYSHISDLKRHKKIHCADIMPKIE